MSELYGSFAKYYDVLYSEKNYAEEVEDLREILSRKGISEGSALNVACGTGRHDTFLKEHFHVVGVDVSQDMLRIARTRNEDVEYREGDMQSFKENEVFDAVLCLFSSIGYMTTRGDLRRAVKNFAAHTRQGGIIVVEPFVHLGDHREGLLHSSLFEREDSEFHVARLGVAETEGKTAKWTFHITAAEGTEIETVVDEHRLGLFTEDEYKEAFRRAGCSVKKTTATRSDMALYVAVKE